MEKLTVNVGGDRLGSGNKMNVDLRTYNRSSHDLSFVWRNTQSPGTLVPFMIQLGLPGDTFDINLNTQVMTQPTKAALFGSYKLQLDVFTAPIRLYNSWLHNSRLGIGLDMSKVKLPQLEFQLPTWQGIKGFGTLDEQQINSSSLLAYLGIRGGSWKVDGQGLPDTTKATHQKMAIPYLAYFDIYKNYYANKQEEIGYIIHTSSDEPLFNNNWYIQSKEANETQWSRRNEQNTPITIEWNQTEGSSLRIGWSERLNTGDNPSEKINEDTFAFYGDFPGGGDNSAYKQWNELFENVVITRENNGIVIEYQNAINLAIEWDLLGIQIVQNPLVVQTERSPRLEQFNLDYIDEMRDMILSTAGNIVFKIDGSTQPEAKRVYALPLQWNEEINRCNSVFSQEGLLIKTYQSDIFNNWINTEWIDGENGINAISSVDVSSGLLQIDSLNLAKKVYDMLNRIAISGGTYKDWLETVYTHDYIHRAEIPVYEGGMSKEIVFGEVVSNSATEDEPLGTLAGRGYDGGREKGGTVVIRVDEPCFIIGIASITPRIDYSQGNEWYTDLKTMNDLHKPALDGIGFQELITEQMAAWDTIKLEDSNTYIKHSAGKQPAWIHYMTNFNRSYGNFARPNNQMFMTLNRRYEFFDRSGAPVQNPGSVIDDLTTYIQPDKYNYSFAQSDITAMNFWVQIAANITARRVMSAKIIPNL